LPRQSRSLTEKPVENNHDYESEVVNDSGPTEFIAGSDDIKLVESLKNPQTANFAFSKLIDQYQQRVYFHVRRIVIDHDDANDVVQNTFIKVWKGIQGFREDSKLFTWIYRIATNESLTFLKRKRTRFFIPLVNVERQLSEQVSNDPLFSADKLQQKIQQAILKLPEKQRIVFVMRYYDEIKYEDMSEILGTSVGALKASYHHAMNKIQKFVTEG